VAEVDSGYFVGDYSLLDADREIPFHFLQRNEHLLADFRNEYATDRMIWFSNRFYSVEKVNDETRFFTLKFGMTGFDVSKPLSESVPFYYQMKRNPEGKLEIESVRKVKDLDLPKVFKQLYARVLGERDAYQENSENRNSAQ
jgi:inner membrane protein